MWSFDEEMGALQKRYAAMFGRDGLGRFSNFTQARDDVAKVMKAAIGRGTPPTDDEIKWLNRHVVEGVEY